MEIFKSFRSSTKYSEAEQAEKEEINKFLSETPATKDTSCGFWIFKGLFLQRFANQTAYVILYGLAGCFFSMTFSYFNGTITTIEKRFKIPSKHTGIISVGYDISQIFVSVILSYYAGKGHRPRWIGFGLLTVVIFCLLCATPHLIYGPGNDALSYTVEFGGKLDENITMGLIERQRSKTLCRPEDDGVGCEKDDGNLTPQVIFFLACLISGIGGSIYYALGISYMDDNTKKSHTPVLLSLSYFLRMMGPAFGFALASLCLRFYISPQLSPLIQIDDPRWLGAWWMGWLILGSIVFICGILMAMFPKELPRAAARRMIKKDQQKQNQKSPEEEKLVNKPVETEEIKSSFQDMMQTYKSLLVNKIYMCNNLSSVFYFFGYNPYWIFTPKYIEIIYRQSASTSSMVTGTVALAFSAIGVLLAGFVISKYKPSARYMAAWNVLVGFLSVAGMVAYAFIGCPGNEKSMVVNIPSSNSSDMLNLTPSCNSNCHCDYVPYSPICGENQMTYISPCHAGCKKQATDESGKKNFFECACISSFNDGSDVLKLEKVVMNGSTISASELKLASVIKASSPEHISGGRASSGACPVDCDIQFFTFLAVMCFLKFIGAAGRASNFLVSVRCVPEKDKTASIGLNMMMMCLCAFIPSPIFFGWLIDSLCLVWGKTCTNKGNCWLYDPESLRYGLNLTASAFVTVGSIFDIGVWYYVKDLKIFDDEIQEVELEKIKNESEEFPENKI